MQKIIVPTDMDGLRQGMDFVEETMKQQHLRSKEIRDALLLSEESMVRLIEFAEPGSTMHVSISFRAGLADITLSAPGEPLPQPRTEFDLSADDSGLTRDTEMAIREVLLHANQDKINYVRKGSYNFIKIHAGNRERMFATRSLLAFALAIAVGLILQSALPQTAQQTLSDYLLTPIQTAFINALKMTMGPAVFFAIVAGISRFSSFADPGRVSLKVSVAYIATSVVAVLTGIGISLLLRPGKLGELSNYAMQGVTPAPSDSESLVNMVVNIIPSNIIEPFLSLDTLQLIFTALVCGIALGKIGDYSSALSTAAHALQSLFNKMTELIYALVPYVVFFSTVALLLNVGTRLLLSLMQMLLVLLLALAVMLLFYMLILITSGINPLIFLKKYAPTMWDTFLAGSGIAALPKTMRCCKNSLGISPKVYSFSIPFGAMINMDGNCIYLTISCLFLARLCGVTLSPNDILPLIFTVVMLSIGAPMAWGTTLLCITVLLNHMGVPLVTIGSLLGLNVAVEMLLGMSNTLGDVVIALAVAKTEGLLDRDAFLSKPTPRRRKKVKQ
ncbi:MAG: dicarboxylate/amino acid:cation symporter [Clostridiales bacterium]|nr:dicarboxylate/amino acid:cation symporter [Candidatus Cacconaster stercorequi]